MSFKRKYEVLKKNDRFYIYEKETDQYIQHFTNENRANALCKGLNKRGAGFRGETPKFFANGVNQVFS